MALMDNKVITVAQGFVYLNSVGAIAPIPTVVDTLNTNTFGCDVHNIEVNTDATSVVLTVGADSTASIALPATAEQVQGALEALASVGGGNTDVQGVSLTDGTGLTVGFVGTLAGNSFTVTGTATGGTTPAVTVTSVSVPNGWVNVGHTSRGDLPEFGFDGGKRTMRGTWQRKRLRQVDSADAVEDHLKFTLEQWDPASMELYFGSDSADTPGVFGVDGNFTPIEKSLFVVLIDGDARVGFYAPKVEISRNSAIKMPLDNFAGLPVKAVFLNYGTRPLYNWISLDMFGAS